MARASASRIARHHDLRTANTSKNNAVGKSKARAGTSIGTVLKYIQSNSVPSRLLPSRYLLNPRRGPKSNRTSRLFSVVLSKGRATKNSCEPGGLVTFSKLTHFRNTENLVKPLCLEMDMVKTLSSRGEKAPPAPPQYREKAPRTLQRNLGDQGVSMMVFECT